LRESDLNIEKVLENWDVSDALREIMANVIDEQLLTNTSDITSNAINEQLFTKTRDIE
jgi:3-hydroxyacyl-CoA dehydrogenase